MALDPKLLEILCCPELKTALRELNAEETESVNGMIEKGELKNKKGDAVSEAIQTGLLREDGKILYPVRQDIPILLIEEGIVMPENGLSR